MIIKNKDLENIVTQLTEFINAEFPIEIAIKIGKLSEKLVLEFTNYYTRRKEIIAKYGVIKEKEVVVLKDNIKAFQEEMEVLNSEEVEINDRELIFLKDIPKDVKISPKGIAILLNKIIIE